MRAKPKTNAPRIEPTIEKVEVSARVERERERERQVPLFEPAGLERAAVARRCSTIRRPNEGGYSAEALEAMSRLVEIKLADFGIEAEVVAVHPGPVVTRFELKPAAGVKSSQISNLAKDLARSLATVSVRVVEIIPGKPYVGLEIPNEVREIVALGEIVKSQAYDELKSPLTLALGKDIGGQPMVADLARMPHLLIAGTTGSGKSVALNAMVLSLLYKATPEHVRLIMIDPKMLELSVYEGIPHLLAPVVTDMKQAANALRWCVAEMERRYALMAGLGVRHLSSYNKKVVGRDRERQAAARSDVHAGDGAASSGARAANDAVHRRHHRRARRHDDDGRQEGRGADRAARAEGARFGHPHDRRDAAAVGRRDHGPHQGEHSVPHRVSGVCQSRLAHDSRSDRRRALARARRHALSAVRYVDADSRSRRVRFGQRGAFGCQGAARERRPELHRRRARRAVPATCSGSSPPRRVGELDGEQDPLYDQAVQNRYRNAQSLHFRHSAAFENRLQPSGANGRDHGGGWHRWKLADEWIPGGACAAAARSSIEHALVLLGARLRATAGAQPTG